MRLHDVKYRRNGREIEALIFTDELTNEQKLALGVRDTEELEVMAEVDIEATDIGPVAILSDILVYGPKGDIVLDRGDVDNVDRIESDLQDTYGSIYIELIEMEKYE